MKIVKGVFKVLGWTTLVYLLFDVCVLLWVGVGAYSKRNKGYSNIDILCGRAPWFEETLDDWREVFDF